MNDKDKLVQAGIGIWINPADTSFDEKMWRYGKREPDSELQKAQILCDAGRYREAKDCYRKLLRHKETMYVHSQLASLCTLYEALELARSSEPKPVKSLYYNRVLQLNPNHKEAHSFFQSPFSRLAKWIALLLLLALLFWGLFWFTRHYILHDVTTTEVIHTDNFIYRVGQVPNGSFSGIVTVHQPISNSSLIHEVDTAGLPEGKTYRINDESHTGIGYVTHLGNNTYNIYLLKPVVPVPFHGDAASPPVSPMTLNTIRTAYDYYLQTHHGTAPKSLSELQSYLPDLIPIEKVAYNPSVYSPVKAVAEPNGLFVPFQKPTVIVNLPLRNLTVKYGNQTVLSSPIGLGPASSPTPVGEFTITNRIQNHGPAIYGPYIFPLNNSEFAIHGTNDPKRIGQTISLGCVEVPNPIDSNLNQILAIGTPVVITNQRDGSMSNPVQYRD